MGRDLSRLLKSCRDIMRQDKGLSGDLDRLPQLSWMLLLRLLDVAGDQVVPPPYRWRDWAARHGSLTGSQLISFVGDDEALLPDGTRGPGLFARLGSLSGDERRAIIAAVFQGTRNRMFSGRLLRQLLDRLDDIGQEPDDLLTLSQLYEGMLAQLGSAAGDSGEFYTPRPVVRLMVALTDPGPGETVLDPACGTGGFLLEAHQHLARLGHSSHLAGVEAKSLPHLLAQVNLLLHGVWEPSIEHRNSLTIQEVAPPSADVILTNPPFGGEEEASVQAGFPRELRTRDTTLLFMQLIMDRLGAPDGRAAVVVPESFMGDGGAARMVRMKLVQGFDLHTVVRLPRGVFEPYTDIQTNLLFFSRGGPTSVVWFYQQMVPRQRRGLLNPCYTRTHPLRFEELEPIIRWWSRRQETTQAWRVTADELRQRDYTLDFRCPGRSPTRRRGQVGAMVERVESSMDRARALVTEATPHLGPAVAVDPGDWPLLPLGAFLTRVKERAVIDPERDYHQVTVRLHGRGVVRRATVKGSALGASRQLVARAGQLIMSRIDARNGAFGIVPAPLDGAVVTGDFPLYRLTPDAVNARYLALVLCSQTFVDLCARCSRGTTNRKRINEALLLDQRLRMPPLEVQRRAVDLAHKLRSLQQEADSLGQHSSDLLALLAEAHLALDNSGFQNR